MRIVIALGGNALLRRGDPMTTEVQRRNIATDVDGVYLDWGTPQQRRLGQVAPEDLAGLELAAGSTGPKAEAATWFAAKAGRRAAIGLLADVAGMVAGTAGTNIMAQKAPDEVGPGSLISRQEGVSRWTRPE